MTDNELWVCVEQRLDDLSKETLEEMTRLNSLDTSAIEKCPSGLDALDYCTSIAIGYLAITITTDEEFSIYLEDIHKSASGASGEYDKLQTVLGKLLYHKGDDIDTITAPFKNRKGGNAYGAFHRLLWGHDILSSQEDNPIVLMVKQRGLSGIIQAFQHLVADTASKQGLPLPGSSYLDFEKENGSLSNYLIKVSEEISVESVGNKRLAQSIYSHMFTIRAQDCAGNVVIENLSLGYFKARNISDQTRIIQFKLISYIIAFLGHFYIGSLRQEGVPYFNVTEFKGLVGYLTELYIVGWKDVREMSRRSDACVNKSEQVISDIDNTVKMIGSPGDDYDLKLRNGQKNVDALIGLLGDD